MKRHFYVSEDLDDLERIEEVGKATPRWIVMEQQSIRKITSDTFP